MMIDWGKTRVVSVDDELGWSLKQWWTGLV